MSLLLVLLSCKGDSEEEQIEALLEGLAAIYLAPDATIVPVGKTLQMKAEGVYEDRSTADLTAVVDWSSSDAGVASISNELDEEGLLTGEATGAATVTALLGDFASTEASVEVTAADLLGLSVEPGELALSVGQEVQLTAWAAYSGGQRADATGMVRWITGDGSVATVDDGLVTGKASGSTSITASLDSAESAEVPVTVSGSSGGTSGSGADLVIAGVTAEASGGTLVLEVTVENQGSGSASGFYTDVWIDPPSTIETYGDGYVWIDYLGPGASASYAFSFSVSSGKHDVYVYADTEDDVAEANEGNNDFYGSLSTGSGGSTSGPNLEIGYFDWLADDESVYYYVDVTNTGAESVGSFYVDLYVDASSEPVLYEDGDTYTTVKSLAAGATTYADFLLDTTACVYGCWSYVQIDSYDDVEETDESDNVAGPLYVTQD